MDGAYVMVLDAETEESVRKLIAEQRRDAPTFARLRAALALERDELAALLALSEEDVARFETGADAPDAETWSLLERLVSDHLTLRSKVRDPGEWIGGGRGEPGGG
jgi:DNA-binding transcriptional regulator YiaG